MLRHNKWLWPARLIIGSLALIGSFPVLMIGMLLAIAGDFDKAEWYLDHAPLILWLDYIEQKGREE